MHTQFKILNADGLIEGAKIECIEDDECLSVFRFY